MNNQKSVHELHAEIGRKIWDAEYFGSNGAVPLASNAFLNSNWNNADELSAVTLMYVSTLYSALVHSVAQLKRFRLGYVFLGMKVLLKLRCMMSFLFRKNLHKNLDASQKEVLMAVLMVMDVVLPFAGYYKLAKKIGIEILCDCNCSMSTNLLVVARFSRLRFYNQEKKICCKQKVWVAIRLRSTQEKVDWKTINRLARLIDDDEMVKYSAPLSESVDVMVKSGV